MEAIVFVLSFFVSLLIAFFVLKYRIKLILKLLINFVSLLCLGLFVLLSGLEEISLLLYILLIIVTFLGILMRILSWVILNFVGIFITKITRQDYEWQKYDQLIKAEQSGNKMYFCIFTFTSLKVTLYIVLIASFLGLV